MKALVAGIGNIFMGDEGFGCEVVQQLARKALPPGVDALDFGIRGLDLGLALSSGDYATAILVDTARRGGAPGSLYLTDAPAACGGVGGASPFEPHAMNPARVLDLAASLGWRCRSVRVLACEPADLGGDGGRMGLSEAVAASVEPALIEVMRLLSVHPAIEDSDTGESGACFATARRRTSRAGCA